MGKRRDVPKQHSMDVDKQGKPAASAAADGWDYGGAAAAEPADDMVADGGAGAVAPPRTAPSVSIATDGAASKMGLFGLVSGGGAKKRKVQMSFKQKRRKMGKIAKAVARGERETVKRHSAGTRKESKNTLKKLW